MTPYGMTLNSVPPNAYASMPARPYSPDETDPLYSLPAVPPPQPLPSWIPQNVQNYINQTPSYAEGQRQTIAPPSIAGGEPYLPTPQIDDIRNLFRNRITKNAPTSEDPAIHAEMFRQLMKMPGFSGFTGGDEI